MKQLTWEEYYDGFYDWAPSTQKSYAYRLSDYGPADEVWEIAEELDFVDNAFSAKFLEKAFSAGVRFTPEQVLEEEEGVQIMRVLGKNMAWILKSIEAGRREGLSRPESEARISTNYIR